MDSLLPILAWWVGLLLPGWVAFILLKHYFDRLPDHGYALAKVIGLVGLSYIAWLLANLHLVPFGRWGVTGILIVGAGAAAAYALKYRSPLSTYVNRLILMEEGLFLACLVAWSIVRSFNPRAEGVEKLMDVAILNGLLRSQWLPPADVWFAGSTVNYYYFGHFMVATLSKLTHVPVEYAANLGLIGVFALTVTLTFSLVVALTASKTAGLVAAFLLALSSNLDPAINTLKQTKNYIFFSATRLDPYTINEFPLYSFVVADMHAHMLDLPVVTAIMALLYVLYSHPDKLPWPLLAVLALLLGATGPTNSFDLAIYGGLTGLVLLARQFYRHGVSWPSLGRAVGLSLAVGAASLALYLPFYLHFHPPVGGVGLALFKTPLLFILNNFGVMLVICLPLFWLLPRLWQGWQDRRHLPELPVSYGLLLLMAALIVIAVPEFIYLKDIYAFQNPPYARANTIFKVYYQAWVLLAVASGVGLGWIQHSQWPKRWANGYVLTVGILIGLSLVGTWSGFSTLKDHQPSTLNSYAYLQNENPDQWALVNWINQHISGQPRLLEAAGESYTQRSLISAYTGLIVPIGWASHEWGWRYSPTEWDAIASRMGDVSIMYTTTDSAELRRLIDKWQIDYIVASPVEWQQYNLTSYQTLQQTYGQPIFSQGQYQLYKTGR
jgi:uncharacterized membrane protein